MTVRKASGCAAWIEPETISAAETVHREKRKCGRLSSKSIEMSVARSMASVGCAEAKAPQKIRQQPLRDQIVQEHLAATTAKRMSRAIFFARLQFSPARSNKTVMLSENAAAIVRYSFKSMTGFEPSTYTSRRGAAGRWPGHLELMAPNHEVGTHVLSKRSMNQETFRCGAIGSLDGARAVLNVIQFQLA